MFDDTLYLLNKATDVFNKKPFKKNKKLKEHLSETPTGKKVYWHANASHEDYEHFDEHDHLHAAQTHYKKAKEAHKRMNQTDSTLKFAHNRILDHHLRAYKNHMKKTKKERQKS